MFRPFAIDAATIKRACRRLVIAIALGGMLMAGGGAAFALAKAGSGSQAPAAAASAAAVNCPPGKDDIQHWTVVVAILLVTVLGTLVSLFPIVAYILLSWGWREHVIFCSLSAKAKDQYLSLYHRQDSHEATADKRFADFYRKWFGRARLIVPTILIGVIVAIYCFILACFAAQKLFDWSIIYLEPANASDATLRALKIAVAAIAGAYTLVSLDAISRVIKRDLSAEDLYLYALRFMSCVPVGYALSSLVPNDVSMVVAFTVGAFPLQVIANMLRQNTQKQLGQVAPQDTANDLVTKLAGVDLAVFERVSSIGITTIAQLAESDPIQLTMRTNLAFLYLLDLVSQSLAWNYLETRSDTLRPMGLRGACEFGVLSADAHNPNSPYHLNSLTVIAQAAPAIALTPEQFTNVLHQIADDPYTMFLVEAYG